ncbi:hypothetical protein BAY61_04930 [Prauserella marina]|uniref:Uncharacterized protein n=1 Tax=Prauserella marina TaxID=530584 RepID=A0A222VL11_9PSEU|nr:hypothetical protein [Prauserella marina]ASR34443.1 hypothetical protein BAY61_04930 [Prauserella marina]PWV71001.1 hypothetical protein DES30_11355 [Prauserella marina]SDD99810.1 hypothetical protein SAMN05421630_11612 [Prauserella marina]
MVPSKRSLAEQLGGALPEGIDALDEEHKQVLGDALRAARRRQAAALSAAAEESLSHVPFLLRGAVRKAAGL